MAASYQSDSGTSTEDPDSDATVEPDPRDFLNNSLDSDATVEPDPMDFLNNSPDLFEDCDTAGPQSTTVTALTNRRSAVHDISDSESDVESLVVSQKPAETDKKKFMEDFLIMSSDSDSDRGNNNVSKSSRIKTIMSTEKKNNSQHKQTPEHKSVSKEQLKSVSSTNLSEQKPHKKDYSTPFLSSKDVTPKSKPRERTNDSKFHASSSVGSSKTPDRKVSSSPRSFTESHKHGRESGDSHSLSKIKNSQTVRSQSNSPLVGMKRKHSSSPVQHKLSRVDTEPVAADHNTNAKRKRKPECQYGSKCYRKNPTHLAEFNHPDNEEPSTSSARPHKTAKASRSTSPKPSTSPSARKTSVPSETKSKSPPGSSQTVRGRLFDLAQPYSFFLTKVAGIADKYNSALAVDIKDILSPEMGKLESSCQFNFMFDIPWLMKQYPAPYRSRPILIVHGEKGPSKASLQAQAMTYSNVKFCQAQLEMAWGTHHTKMMLLLYDTGMRVVIHTANITENDWHQKTQGVWMSPVFPKLASPSREKGDSPSHFKRDLLDYVAAYKAYQLKEWIDHISHHDMSQARVVIIGSVPGRHIGDKMSAWGHLKLRRTLKEHGPGPGTVKTWPVVGQFSSIGSMGPSKETWLCGEWLQSLSAARATAGPQTCARLQLIFPSKDNVRLSLEGFPAGGSIPYGLQTAKKQTYIHDFFHVWKSDGRGRTKAMPHIKTYVRPEQTGGRAAWFIVTSANLSKAAWGALEKKGVQLMIRSYEIGVLFLPKFFDGKETFDVTSDTNTATTRDCLPLPYDLPVTHYTKADRPWVWDIPYMDLPDTNGNIWCPFSK